MKITFISDTHNKHNDIPKELLPGGDVLIHAGDVSGRGYINEIYPFLDWFMEQDQYEHKVFIAGNHDFFMEDNPSLFKSVMATDDMKNKNVHYLMDNYVIIDGFKIYGSPWQPEFYNWAFNLPRKGDKLRRVWENVPTDTDILVTHGPPHGILDSVPDDKLVGCELLKKEVTDRIKPMVHVFGHIHYSYGMKEVDGVKYINAAVLGEDYKYHNPPITLELLKP